MKVISIAAAGVSLALIALTLAPSAGEYRAYFAAGALIGSVVALVTIVVGWREPTVALGSRPPDPSPMVSVRAHEVSLKAPSPPSTASGNVEVVGFLTALQEKGRFVDFLQDDITGYSDAQVGAAARVVHQGCKAVLKDSIRIVPVRPEHEGATVSVPAGYIADEYRLVGKISGQAPFSGTLMHRGWKAESVTLPRMLRTADDQLPIIAPAEIELR